MNEQENTAQTSDTTENTVAEENAANDTEVAEASQESESQSTPEAKEQKSAQTKEVNAEFARARREKERAQELHKARTEAETAERVKNVIEFVKTNPYTNKPITNATEVEQYLRMKKIADAGGSPVEDYGDEIDREQQAKRDEEKKRAESQAKIQSDVSDFRSAYPDVNLSELLTNDDLFRVLMENNLSNESEKTLKDVYGDYLKIKNKYEKEAEIKVTRSIAKRNSGAGSADKGIAKPTYTKEDVLKMPYAERAKLYNNNRTLYESVMKK